MNEQALVEFQIGGYKDRILCDAVPMDCCHLLLGRPWQFDKHAIYDGRDNTYTIEKDRNTIILTPLQEDVKEQTKAAKVIMMGKKEFVEVEDGKHEECAVTPRGEDVKTVILKGVSVLEKNDDVMMAKTGQEKAKYGLFVKTPNNLEKCDDMVVGTMLCPSVGRKVCGQLYPTSTEVNKSDETEVFGSENLRKDVKTKGEVSKGVWQGQVGEFEHATRMEKRSAQGEDFAVATRDIHQQVKENLQRSVEKYKKHAELKKTDIQFKVGDMVLAHLRKERFCLKANTPSC